MQVTVLYVGSSLLAPLKNAEREINGQYKLDLRVAAYNFGSPLSQIEWNEVDRDLAMSDVVFVIHVMDGENAARLVPALERYGKRHHAIIVINCMPELMRRTRMGSLDVSRFFGSSPGDKRSAGEEGERAKFKSAFSFSAPPAHGSAGRPGETVQVVSRNSDTDTANISNWWTGCQTFSGSFQQQEDFVM